MISSQDAQQLHADIGVAHAVTRSKTAREALERALLIATAVVEDTINPPNVVVRTANASFEMTDLIPEILAAQEAQIP